MPKSPKHKASKDSVLDEDPVNVSKASAKMGKVAKPKQGIKSKRRSQASKPKNDASTGAKRQAAETPSRRTREEKVHKQTTLAVPPSGEDEEDTTIYKVVINHEEQYSIWPAYRELPLGWTSVGKEGRKSECLSYIDEVWVDMRPLSVRQRMDASG